jgi:hypothetical protein
MMNVNFNGYGENVLTFIADSSLTEPGVFVKMTADGTVGKCSSGDVFCGVCVGLRGGYAAVQLSGYVNMPAASAKIAVGYKKLGVGDGGKAAVNTSGREVLVLDSTATEVGFIL